MFFLKWNDDVERNGILILGVLINDYVIIFVLLWFYMSNEYGGRIELLFILKNF